MPMSCAVSGCKTRIGDSSFHKFPADAELERLWLYNLRWPASKPHKWARVCGSHFVDGSPSLANPLPTRNLGHLHHLVSGEAYHQGLVTMEEQVAGSSVVEQDDSSMGDDGISAINAISIKEESGGNGKSASGVHVHIKQEVEDDDVEESQTTNVQDSNAFSVLVKEEAEISPAFTVRVKQEMEEDFVPGGGSLDHSTYGTNSLQGGRLRLLPARQPGPRVPIQQRARAGLMTRFGVDAHASPIRSLAPRIMINAGQVVRLARPGLVASSSIQPTNRPPARVGLPATIAGASSSGRVFRISSGSAISASATAHIHSDSSGALPVILPAVNKGRQMGLEAATATATVFAIEDSGRTQAVSMASTSGVAARKAAGFTPTFGSASVDNGTAALVPPVVGSAAGATSDALRLGQKPLAKPKYSEAGTSPMRVWDDDANSNDIVCTGNVDIPNLPAVASFQRQFPASCCSRCEVMSIARLRLDPVPMFSVYTGMELDTFDVLAKDVSSYANVLKTLSKDEDDENRVERIKYRADPDGPQWKRPASYEDELLMTVMKLRTNFPATALAYLFGYETDVAVDVLQCWIPFLAVWMEPFIAWPSEKADFVDLIPTLVRKSFGERAFAVLDVVEVTVAFDDYTEEPATAKFVVVYNWLGAVVYRSRLFDGQATTDKDAILSCADDIGFSYARPERAVGKRDLYVVHRQSCLANEHCSLLEKPKNHFAALVGQIISKLGQFAILSDSAFPSGLIPCLDEIVTVCCALLNLLPMEERNEKGRGKKTKETDLVIQL